jgi:hypothetical protein
MNFYQQDLLQKQGTKLTTLIQQEMLEAQIAKKQEPKPSAKKEEEDDVDLLDLNFEKKENKENKTPVDLGGDKEVDLLDLDFTQMGNGQEVNGNGLKNVNETEIDVDLTPIPPPVKAPKKTTLDDIDEFSLFDKFK